MSCGIGCRCGSYPVLLYLWCRLEAVTLIGPLALEPPYATGVALKSKKKKVTINLKSKDLPIYFDLSIYLPTYPSVNSVKYLLSTTCIECCVL